MKIAFDQQVFLLQEYGGISRYICSLAKHLAQMPDVDARVVASLHFNRNLNALHGVPGKGIFLPKLPSKIFRLAIEASKHLSRRTINRFEPDILHETYFSCDDYRPHKAKRVLTVYDMIHEKYADMFDQSSMTSGPKKAAALRADHVICISENTRRDLIEFCGVPEERTSVVYLSADVEFEVAANTSKEKRLHGERPFLLYVGNRGGYKNFDRFVRAFAQSEYLKKEFDIICFGGGSLSTAELAAAAGHGLSDNQLGYRSGSDSVLASLYLGAEALVYPSLYEGFGIPPLEAMAAGCAVICSNTSSLPEVVGEAGEYFDPNSEESMMSAMELVLQSEERRADLVACGLQQYRTFSWEKCARETMSIYRSLT